MSTAGYRSALAASAGNRSRETELSYRTRSGRTAAGAYFVPQSDEEWHRLARLVRDHVRRHELIAPLDLEELREHAGTILKDAGLPEKYRDFLTIFIHNEVWRDVIAAIPFKRRTLLLPPCLRSNGKCTAEFDEFGLLCKRCGSCDIGRISAEAEALGYAVLVAEGTSIVEELIEKGMVDGGIGVSCMASLERAFPHMAASAAPGIAIPLLKDGCKDTAVGIGWVRDLLLLKSDEPGAGLFDLNEVLSEVQSWFSEKNLRSVLKLGKTRTEEIAVSWLAKAGKRWRPFLAVCVYKALCERPTNALPDDIRTIAIAVECIHKASLIYDDIQDDDDIRYGESTVHRTHGVPVALTASLYLLGQGYRLIAECRASSAQRTEMLKLATQGHCDLCLGQGAELLWMAQPVPLTPDEVLGIFRLKTAPSFDVVLRLGAICAGASDEVQAVLKAYSECVGIAYQIQDDLQDFRSGGDVDDVKAGRPSLLTSLAHEGAGEEDRRKIDRAWRGEIDGAEADGIRTLFTDNNVEQKARAVLERYKRQALLSLRPLRNRGLKILLHRIVAKILKSA